MDLDLAGVGLVADGLKEATFVETKIRPFDHVPLISFEISGFLLLEAKKLGSLLSRNPSVPCRKEGPMQDDLNEITAERFILRDPKTKEIRAVLETKPFEGEGEEALPSTVCLSMLDGTGEAKLVAEVQGDGTARLFVGNPERGRTVAIEQRGLWLWANGNIVASLDSAEERGMLDLCDRNGESVVVLPSNES